ncbi:MAG TPA: phosphoenolpyruvate carboxykinase domain-containing protein, partial [Myxococcota bacterium]|nr:phosphoenolpyruvate carboxykinase domain-containing protein [Myxococcota bacterium]
HWLRVGRAEGAKLPKIFWVNWFRKGPNGEFLWPGYGENSRVLKWVFERCEGVAKGVDTPIGILPSEGELETDGLDLDPEDLAVLLGADVDGWLAELPLIREHYAVFGDRLPLELSKELSALEQRLKAARS